MQIGLIESLMTVGKEQLVQGEMKGENEGDDFHTLLTKLVSGNGQEDVDFNDLGKGEWKTTSFDKNFLPLIESLFTEEDALPSDQKNLNTVSFEDLQTVLNNLISAIFSEMDEDAKMEFNELKTIVKEMDEDNFDQSMIAVFNILNELITSFKSTDQLKENVVPLLKMADQMIRYQRIGERPINQPSLQVLETFIKKYGSDLDLQSVYARWNGNDGTKERNILFPFPLGQNHFQVSQIKHYLTNHSNQEGISNQGVASGQGLIKVNTSSTLSLQNEKNTGFSYINQQLERSAKGNTDQPIVNRSSSTGNPFQGEEKVLKNNEKIEGSFSVMNKTQPFQQTGQPETLKLIDRDQQPVSYKQFEKEFSSILSRGNFIKNGNVQRLTVKLHPEHLGELKIELVQKQGEMIAKIISSTDRAKELLETQLSSLRHAFVQQNINVTRIDMQTEGSFDGLEDQNQPFYGSGGYSNDQNEDRETKDESTEMTFQEALFNMEI